MLYVSDGPSRGRRLTLSRGSVIVGSDPACDLVIADDTISRRHASVGLVESGVHVRDLGSRNGTRYLGARIEAATISTGGSMKLGRTTVQVLEPAPPEPEGEVVEGLGLLARSRPMKRLLARLPKVASSDATVLIRGETGTGKTELARAIHRLSPRGGRALVTVECGAIAAGVIESQLFGHLRGAFTGADRDRPGLVAAAEGSVLVLEEVSDLPLELQPRLLRLLEEREYVRLGADRPTRADLRVIATTGKDLEVEAKRGRFRTDLYFRLSAVELELPALRDRRDDIALLAAHFAHQLKGVGVRLAPATLAAFQCQRWPGNVRELKNAVNQALTLGSRDAPTEPPSFTEARDEALLHFERDYLLALLDENGGNVSAAARSAKLARSYFYTLLERHRLVANPAAK